MAVHSYHANINACNVVSATASYPPSTVTEMKSFANLLEREGFLQSAKRQKHILTPSKLDTVLVTLWKLPMPPINCITMFFDLRLLKITGLCPGKLF